jgi:hypothetical protein
MSIDDEKYQNKLFEAIYNGYNIKLYFNYYIRRKIPVFKQAFYGD